MDIEGRIAVVTGAASGIGRAVVEDLVSHKAACVVAVDLSPEVIDVAGDIEDTNHGATRVKPFAGNVTDREFRRHVFDCVTADIGTPTICVPAAGIARDRLAAKVDPATGRAEIYPIEDFELVLEVDLVAPVYWALGMLGKIAEAAVAQPTKALVARGGHSRCDHSHRLGILAGQSRTDFLFGGEGRPGRRRVDVDEGGDVLRGTMHGNPSRFHGHADGPSTRRRVHQEPDSACHPAWAPHQTARNCGSRVLHDRESCGQRRTLGRCRLASGRVTERHERSHLKD